MKKLIKNSNYDFRVKYYADSNGHIWSESKQDYLTEYDDKNGYKKVYLMTLDKPAGKGHRFSVHRLVMQTFYPVPNMSNLQVDHIDGNIKNNSLSNLRWATVKENLDNPNTKPNRRVYDQDGTHNASAKFTLEELLNLIKDINSGKYKRKQIMMKYNICDETLRKIINKITYSKELQNIEIIPNFIPDIAGAPNYGEDNGNAKLNNEKVLQIIKLMKEKKNTDSEIAIIFGVSKATINRIRNKQSWKHLTKDITFN